jgi:hypothetical protein
VQAIEDGGGLGSRSPDCHRSNDRPPTKSWPRLP